MAQYSKGSSGADVKKLQEALVAAGYDVGSTGADGVYGAKTEAAVKAYQKANGLTVDGIAGKNTLGALYSKPAASTPTTPTAPTTPTTPTTPSTPTAPETPIVESQEKAPAAGQPNFSYPEFAYQSYGESDIVQQARELLAQHSATKPGDYVSAWKDEADAYLSQYQNRDEFSYDFNSDALYNQYKDQYIQQGKMASMDVMGQAAAMTGGYGNSYAQTVGQQAYNQQLGQLNQIMPELYGMALDRYTQEGQQLLDMYGLYMDKDAQDYARYQDGLNNWYTQLQYLTDSYENERALDYDKYSADRSLAYDEYSTGRSQAYDDYWNTINMDYQEKRDAISDARYEQERADDLAAAEAAANARSSGSDDDDKPSYLKMEAGDTAYNTLMKDVERAADVNALKSIVARYVALGYDPNVIDAFTKDAYNKLKIGSPIDTTVNTDGSTSGLGGGGGGTWYWDYK